MNFAVYLIQNGKLVKVEPSSEWHRKAWAEAEKLASIMDSAVVARGFD